MNRVQAKRLLPRYFSGELTEDERRTLMEAVLTDQDIYNAFAEEQVLSGLLEDAEFRREVKVIVAPRQSALAAIGAFLRDLTPGWKIAMVAGLVLVLLSAGLLKRSMRSEKRVARVGVPAVTGPAQRAPAVIALLLLPAERASGVENTLHFPPGRQTIQLQVDLEEDAYPQYEAVLETADRTPVRTCGDLRTQRVPGSSRLVIELGCDSLADGVYMVTIFGYRDGGKRESVGGYTFRVNY